MRSPPQHIVRPFVAALIVVAVFALTRVDAAAFTVIEDFSTVDEQVAQSWTVSSSGGVLQLPQSGPLAWRAVDALSNVSVASAAFSPAYATDGTAIIGATDGIYRTTDRGITGTQRLATATAVQDIAFSPAFSSDRKVIVITYSNGIWGSLDGGVSWDLVDVRSGEGIAASPAFATDGVVIAAARGDVLKSTDGGLSFAVSSSGIDSTTRTNGLLSDVAISSAFASDRTAFVTSRFKGVYRSTDGGATWALANPSGLSSTAALAVATAAGKIAAVFTSGVYASTNNGATWSAVYSGSGIQDVAIAPNGDVLVATSSGVKRATTPATEVFSGWPGGAAFTVAVAPTYGVARSVLGIPESIGAFTPIAGYAASGVATMAPGGIDATADRIVRATITPTATLSAGTSITYALSVADGAASWEGPVTPGQAWTFAASGSTLQWRATLATTDSAATPTLDALTIAYETEDAPPPPAAPATPPEPEPTPSPTPAPEPAPTPTPEPAPMPTPTPAPEPAPEPAPAAPVVEPAPVPAPRSVSKPVAVPKPPTAGRIVSVRDAVGGLSDDGRFSDDGRETSLVLREAEVTSREPQEALTLLSPRADAVTSAQTILVGGNVVEAGRQVAVTVDAVFVSEITSGIGGAFAVALPDVAEGTHDVRARTQTESGAIIEVASHFRVDRTPPPAPEIGNARLAQGASATDDGAFAVTLELDGVLPDDVFADLDALLITVESDPVTIIYQPPQPHWSFRTTLALAPGPHTVAVAARDRAGNVSALPNQLAFAVAPAACGDGVDNDSDGRADFPNDPDCTSIVDAIEATEGVVARTVTVVGTAATAGARAAADATVATVRATATVAGVAATVIREEVLDHPTVEIAAERIVAPAVVVAVATSTAASVSIASVLAFLRSIAGVLLSPSRLFARRSRKGWGTVYDSIAKRPVDLATVRLINVETKRVAATAVTDHLGRYILAVKRAGTYRMDVRHDAYRFPSSVLKGQHEDRAFVALYHGGDIVVHDGGAFVTENVPVDAKETPAVTNADVIRKHRIRVASGIISDAGLAIAIASFAVAPRAHVLALLIVNVLLYILFRRLARRVRQSRSWGVVRDALRREPLRLAVVRLFDSEYGKLLDAVATDHSGRYQFLVGRNAFYVTAEKRGYDEDRSRVVDLRREGIAAVDLALEPKGERG